MSALQEEFTAEETRILEAVPDDDLIQELAHEKTIGSKGKGLFGIPHAQLPAKIQHVFNDLVEGGKKPGPMTYRLAVGIVENWAEGHDGKGNKVSAKVQAEATAAIAEWNELRAKAHARSAGKKAKAVAEEDLVGRIAESWVEEAWSPAARAAALEARRRTAHSYAKELGAHRLDLTKENGGHMATVHLGGGVAQDGFHESDPVMAVHHAFHGDPEDTGKTVPLPPAFRLTRRSRGLLEAELSTKARKSLPDSAFVFPKDKRYPIHDLAHARNALARCAGKPEEGKVKAAVRARYPQLKEEENPKLKCPKCGHDQTASNKKCKKCGHDLADARKAKFAKLQEAWSDDARKAALEARRARSHHGFIAGSVVEVKRGAATYHGIVHGGSASKVRVHIPYFGHNHSSSVDPANISHAPGFLKPGEHVFKTDPAEIRKQEKKLRIHPDDAAVIPEKGEKVVVHGISGDSGHSLGGTDMHGKKVRGAIWPEEVTYDAEGAFGSAGLHHMDLAQGEDLKPGKNAPSKPRPGVRRPRRPRRATGSLYD